MQNNIYNNYGLYN